MILGLGLTKYVGNLAQYIVNIDSRAIGYMEWRICSWWYRITIVGSSPGELYFEKKVRLSKK